MLKAPIILCVLVFIGCSQGNKSKVRGSVIRPDSSYLHSFLQQLFLDKSNLSLVQRKQILDSLQPYIIKTDFRNYNLYLYLSGMLLENSGNSDSAITVFERMLADAEPDSLVNGDLIILKSIGQVHAKGDSWVDGELIAQLQRTIKFAEKIKYRFIYEVYNIAAGAYYKFGDTAMPAKYLKLGFNSYPARKTPSFKAYYYNRMGTCLIMAKRWEEANNYLDSGYRIALTTKDTVLIASTFEKKRSIYDEAGNNKMKVYYQNLAFTIKKKAGLLTEADWSNQALNLQDQGKYRDAIPYYFQSLKLARRSNNYYVIQNAYAGLYQIYEVLKDFEKSGAYLDSSYEAEIAILKKRETDKVADITLKYEREKKDEKILQLNKQNLLQTQILQQQKIIILVLTAFILAVTAIAIIFLRQRKLKIKNERLEAAWNKLSLEQRLLRSQMEPHFLFNILADLQGLIRTNQEKKASHFLGKFARFLRLNLENSRNEWVRLPEEIESLEDYLILQQMRHENSFDYTILGYEGYIDDNILIPPMFLQPFAENAILHGFNNITYKGNIKISIEKTALSVKCIIDDNGIGLASANKKEGSLSTTITRERLQFLRRQTGHPASLEVVDKGKENEHGIRVTLEIPYKVSDI